MNAPYTSTLSDDAIKRIWGSIEPTLPTERSDNPTLLLLGGQPGAGKSKAHAHLHQQLKDGKFTIVDFDDFRKNHPQFRDVGARDPLLMPDVTHKTAAALTELTMRHLRNHKCNVVNENVLQTTSEAIQTSTEFKKSGYAVDVIAVATPAADSELGMLDRYVTALEAHREGILRGDRGVQPARWTALAPHDDGYRELPRSLETLESSGLANRIRIIDREGTLHYDNARADNKHPTAADALEARRNQPMTVQQKIAWLAKRTELYKTADDLRIRDDPRTHQLFKRLDEDAARISLEMQQPNQEKSTEVRPAGADELDGPDVDVDHLDGPDVDDDLDEPDLHP